MGAIASAAFDPQRTLVRLVFKDAQNLVVSSHRQGLG